MRFCETCDNDFFVELPNSWEAYCGYPPDKVWRHTKLKSYNALNYYRDLEGGRMEKITSKDLFLTQKPKNRINKWACLPLLYATGARFIKVEQANPSGFKCAEFPINIKEVRVVRQKLDEIAAEEKKVQILRKKLLKECHAASAGGKAKNKR